MTNQINNIQEIHIFHHHGNMTDETQWKGTQYYTIILMLLHALWDF